MLMSSVQLSATFVMFSMQCKDADELSLGYFRRSLKLQLNISLLKNDVIKRKT